MKKYMILALTMVLTASLFAGCGCTNQHTDTTAPTVLPTNEEIWNSTEATTRHTSAPTTLPETTVPSTAHTDSTTESTIRNYVNSFTDMMNGELRGDR